MVKLKNFLNFYVMILLCLLLVLFLPLNNVYASSEITTSIYYVKDKYIIKISEKTTCENFLKNVVSNSGKTLNVYDGKKVVKATENIKTGMTLKVDDGATYTLIVRGDVNPDGKLTATDLSKLKQYYVGTLELDIPQIKAADINYTDTITVLDISQLKMLLVGFELPELEVTEGNIIVTPNTQEATKEVVLKITVREEANVDYDRILVSTDGGENFKIYEDDLKITENTDVKIQLTKKYTYDDYEILDKNEELPKQTDEETYEEYMKRLVELGYAKKHQITENIMIEETTYIVNNIDNVLPDNFKFTADKTTNSITINAKTKDTAKDYMGNVIEDGIAGIQKYEYRTSEKGWQTENTFTNLTKNTEYTIYVRAIDFAGNVREAENSGLKVKTNDILVNNSDIQFKYENNGYTNEDVNVGIFCEEIEGTDFKIQYQINGTDGEWTDGTNCTVKENCTIYARIVDSTNQEGIGEYKSVKITNIDKNSPLEFTPEIIEETNTNVKIRVNAKDADATETNASSGIVNYVYYIVDTEGKEKVTNELTVNEYNFAELDLENKGYHIYVLVKDNAGNSTISNMIGVGKFPSDGLGIGVINPGPEHETVNGLDYAYYNPVIPAGFKAVNTEDASWEGTMPKDWNKGLVIEDINGNQFVWVPVDGTSVKYEKGTMVWDFGDNAEWNKLNAQIKGDDLPSVLNALNEREKTQIEEYEGFYISRYEIGNDDGVLGSKEGLKVVNGVTYNEAKTYAEAMYRLLNVKSGLLTGSMWDTMTKWIANEKGEKYVTNNIDAGNTYETAFTFSGVYATGPNNSGEKRSEYKAGTNISKNAKTRTLLTTGIVDKFKAKNLYDTAGNVWEYTSEYLVNEEGKKQYIARGGNYYWQYDKVVAAGAAVREFISEREGEKRNEGGFRVALFLVEGAGDIGSFEDYNRTIDGKEASYKNPVIPAGFAAVNDGAKWGNGKNVSPDWNNGLVIEDKAGNQFVWVPVDGTNVKYEKWATSGISYLDVTGDDKSTVLTNWEENEKTQIEKYGGFYIARYEASVDKNGVVQSQNNKNVLVNKTYDEMKEISENIEIKKENQKYVGSGIVTGTQWDTVMRWIANEIGENEVLKDSTSWGTYGEDIFKTGNTMVKNIYDLAGNAWEITVEKVGENNIVYRGGVYSDITAPVAYRGSKIKYYPDQATTFRMVLYVTGEVSSKVTTVPVRNDEALKGTDGSLPIPSAKGNVTFTPNVTNWTNQNILVTLENAKTKYYLEYQINGTTSKWIRIDSLDEVTIEKNCTIYARLTNSKKQAGEAISYAIGNIDKVAPNVFTPKATNVTYEKITINATTTDNLSGIDTYQYYMNGLLVYSGPATSYTKANLAELTTYKIYVVAVDKAGNSIASSTISVKTKEKPRYITDLVKNGTIKVGDWVNYPVEIGSGTNNGSYTLTTAQTGYSSDQTYNVKNYILGWRVLYANTTTGEVELVSAGSTGNLSLGTNGNHWTFWNAYNNIVSTLNTKAKYYVNTDYANRGRGIGTNPNNPDGNAISSIEWIAGYHGDSHYTHDQNAMGTTLGNIGSEYWLGSRFYENSHGNGQVHIRTYDGSTLRKPWFCGANNGGLYASGSTQTRSTRIVIRLRTDVKIDTSDATKNGTSRNNAWQLVSSVVKPEEKLTDLVKNGLLKVGDWVDYSVGSGNGTDNGAYTVTKEQSGYSSNQNYNVKNYSGGWRVLYANASTGEVELISAGSIGNLTLGTTGKHQTFFDAYNNIVSTLNGMAGKYVNTTFANRGRSVGSDPSNPAGNTISSIEWLPAYTNDTTYTYDQAAMGSGMNNIGTEYWYASRDYHNAKGNGQCAVRTYTGSTNSSVWLVAANDGALYASGSTTTKAVRAIVRLKTNLKVDTSDSSRVGITQDKAWKLVAP